MGTVLSLSPLQKDKEGRKERRKKKKKKGKEDEASEEKDRRQRDAAATEEEEDERDAKRKPSVLVHALSWKRRLVAARAKRKGGKKVKPTAAAAAAAAGAQERGPPAAAGAQRGGGGGGGGLKPIPVPVPTVPEHGQNHNHNQSQNQSVLSPRKVVVQASTGELLHCLSDFLCRRCVKLKELPTSQIVLWFRNVDRALLVQGWQDQCFISPASLVFVYLLCREAVDEDTSSEQELQATILTCLYLAYSYLGSEISYPLKPFLVESSREAFWERSLELIQRLSADMLRINADPHFFTEVFQNLKEHGRVRERERREKEKEKEKVRKKVEVEEPEPEGAEPESGGRGEDLDR